MITSVNRKDIKIVLVIYRIILYAALYNYKICTSFVSPEGSKEMANRAGINVIIFTVLRFFSGWLRTGSNPVDITRFQSHTGTVFFFLFF